MSAIGKGDWVEFHPHPECPPSHIAMSGLVVGSIYCVARVYEASNGGTVLDLEGVPPYRSRDHYGFSARAFRPIYRPKSDFIEALKQPAPEREPEHV